MPKRVFIIHGWGGKTDEHWLPWLKKKLTDQGFDVQVPGMPDTDEPVIEKWVKELSRVVGKSDVQTYFVGHSVGCQTIMRYLESLNDQRAGGCIFVAGWFALENMESLEEEAIANPWINTPIDFEKIKNTTDKFTVLLSSNEPYGAVEENRKIFEEKLKASVQILKNKGHFTAEDGVTELPEALNAVVGYSNSL